MMSELCIINLRIKKALSLTLSPNLPLSKFNSQLLPTHNVFIGEPMDGHLMQPLPLCQAPEFAVLFNWEYLL